MEPVPESRKAAQAPAEKAAEPPGLLSLPLIGTALTPMTLALTGMLYLTGWTERNKLLKEFGVSASVVPEPIQNTLARGYTPLMAGIITSVVLLTLFLFVMNKTFRRLENSLGQSVVFPFGTSAGELIRRARVRTVFGILSVCAILLALLISHISGIVSAGIKENRARQMIAKNCEGCFQYRVRGRYLAGKVLAQNDERTVLLVRRGVFLIRTDDISAVAEIE